MDAQVLTVSSKGQISLPVEMREKLSIEKGDKLLAYVYGDSIMLKVLRLPSAEEFERDMAEVQEWARSAGYTADDVDGIIKSVRKEK